MPRARQPDIPVIGAMTALPPALRYRVLDAVAALASQHPPARDDQHDRLARLLDAGVGWLGADPSLADIGRWMIARADPALRRFGCRWLAMFPTVESIERLVAIVDDAEAEPALRRCAIEAIADRQLRDRHPGTTWTPEAIQLADDALFRIADLATTERRLPFTTFPDALRHVQSNEIAAVFARSPALWGGALECFATPPLARVLAVSIDDIAPRHRVRVLRLIAATLGGDSMPLLIARAASTSAAIEERLESAFLTIALEGEPHLPRLETVLRDVRDPELSHARARWHLANPGTIPAVSGLRIARSLATLPVAERTARCERAADDLGALVRFTRHEPGVYELWSWMVRGAADPARAYELVAAHPASLSNVRELYLAELARRGRVRQLLIAAQATPDVGALQLAIRGRPLAALELAATATVHTPELACARALACYRAGRPDLTELVLAEDLPPAELTDDERANPFPGPDETWRVEHAAPSEHRAIRDVAIAALAGGREAVIALAHPAHHDAEPDATSLDGVGAVARRLRRDLRGAAVYIAGELKAPERIAALAALERAGARVVAGPSPGTELYFAIDCPPHVIAELERRGLRRLDTSDLEVT